MRASGRPSWRASIGCGATLAHQALYIRDSCNLPVPAHPTNPPALIGEVADHSAELSDVLLASAGPEWLWWWREVVAYEVRERTSPPPPSSRREAEERLRADHAACQGLFDWPELTALAGRPALRAAAKASLDGALRFRNAAKFAVQRQLESGERPRPMAADPRPIAEALIERLPVAPDRLNATIEILGVSGDWSYQPRPGALLCSLAVAQDGDKVATLIEATFVSALGAA